MIEFSALTTPSSVKRLSKQHLVLKIFFLEISNKYKWLKLLNLCCDKQLFIEKYSSTTNAFQQKEMQSKWRWINFEFRKTVNLGLIKISFKIICRSESLIINFCTVPPQISRKVDYFNLKYI